MDQAQVGALVDRLDRLERTNQTLASECRRWRRGAGAVLVVGMVLGLAGAKEIERIPRTLAAQNFVLRDEAGRVRASLGFRADGTPGFALMDEQSRVRLALDLCADGAPAVNLYDKDGTLQSALAVRPDGSPGLGFFDAQMVRLSLDLGPNRSAPGLSLYDREGTMRAAVAVRADDTPGVGLFDAEGEVALSIDSDTTDARSLNAAATAVKDKNTK